MNTRSHNHLPSLNSAFPIPHSAFRTPHSAFTLIELLVVISIIALLAGLVVAVAPAATAKGRIARARTELTGLTLVISTYHSKKGVYPPDNINSTMQNPLFYELTGTLQTNNGAQTVLRSPVTLETLTTDTNGQISTLFNLPMFINNTADPLELNGLNYDPGLQGQAYASFYIAGSSGPTFSLLGSRVAGPYMTNPISGSSLNPYHYRSSNPTHNPNSYDLWIDITIRGKTNRISNWSDEPEVVGDFTP